MKHRICPAVSYIKNNSKNDQVLTIYDSTDGATCRIHNHEFHVHQTLNRWRHHDILHSFDLGVLLQFENCWRSNRELNFSQKI